MSNSPLFKRAFVRGLNAELIRQAAVVYPSKEAADMTADYVADQSGMPDPVTESDRVDIKVASELIGYLMEGAQVQCKHAGDQYCPQLTKTAQAADPAAWAQEDAIALMEKAAAESDENTLENAAENTAEAARENAERDADYALVGQGGQEQPGGGSTGKERDPSAPGSDTNRKVPGSNSASEQKNASLQDIVRRIAKTGAAADVQEAGPNDMPSAARNSDVLDAEMRERPENYANFGESQGKTEFNIGSDAQTGKEEEHEGVVKTPETRGVTNSVTEMVGGKTAFDQLFERTAKAVIPWLPGKMADEQKVAHVRHMMGLETRERANYLHRMYTSMGHQKEAGAWASAFLKQAASDDEDHDDKRDAKGNKIPAGESGDFKGEEAQVGTSRAEEPDIEPERKKDASARVPPQQTLSALRDRLKNLHA